MHCTLEEPGWGAGATTLRTATLLWSIQQQSTALLSGAAVLTPVQVLFSMVGE